MCDKEYKTFGELSKAEKLELMEAWVDGKQIQVLTDSSGWLNTNTDWSRWYPGYKYRIKPIPLTKPSINWDHVSKEYNWLARDANGRIEVYKTKPYIDCYDWVSAYADFEDAKVFASLDPGTCDWKDSLVERPKDE